MLESRYICTLFEMSNAQQNKPQWADLNLHANLLAILNLPCPVGVGACGFISR